MSFRPTIAIYIGGEICDISYCRNWSYIRLLAEASASMAVFADYPTKQEYMEARYGTQKIYYSLSPVMVENTVENMKELEFVSELPLVVDIDSRCIYQNTCALKGEQLERIHLTDIEYTPEEFKLYQEREGCSFTGNYELYQNMVASAKSGGRNEKAAMRLEYYRLYIPDPDSIALMIADNTYLSDLLTDEIYDLLMEKVSRIREKGENGHGDHI